MPACVLFVGDGKLRRAVSSAPYSPAVEAVRELLATANPQDDFFLITFADTAELAADFTASVADIQSQLLPRQPQGSTALLDAIYLGISEMRRAKYARKALLIISDGGDNHSRYRERDIRSAVREADVLVYAIGIYDRYFATIEEQIGPALLSEVSEETGGRMFTVDNPKDMADIAAKISLELRNQYVLGYHPISPKYDGKWHKIKVKLSLTKGLAAMRRSCKTRLLCTFRIISEEPTGSRSAGTSREALSNHRF
jgi:Ca-activated chloride channel family protein